MNHLDVISRKLPEYELDAMLITSEPGEFYALGLHGEGMAVVTPQGSHYSTDGRYIEAARTQISGAEVSLISNGKSHLSLAKDYLAKQGCLRVGFEEEYVTAGQLWRFEESLPVQLIPAQALMTSLRGSKDQEELAVMRKAQAITDAAFDEILNFIRPGRTEQEIAARLGYEMMRRGALRASFDPIVAAGPNGSRPHAVPGGRVIERGMFITMDFGCVVDGYCSDMTRTVSMGRPTDEMSLVYHTVLQAQQAGIAAARAGITGREIDAAGRAVISEAGYGEYFTHSFGHSLGLEIHEHPNASPSEEQLMPVGAVISAEPGIYLPGRFGVRIEDVLILGRHGCEDITRAPKRLISL